MKFWHVARWVVLIVFAVILTLVLVRGPEDTWVQDAAGHWVAHGHPGAPAPPPGYQPPAIDQTSLRMPALAVTSSNLPLPRLR